MLIYSGAHTDASQSALSSLKWRILHHKTGCHRAAVLVQNAQHSAESPREQGFYGAKQGVAPALLGRFGQGDQDQLRGCVHVFELLCQLLHHKLEAEPAHLHNTSCIQTLQYGHACL